MTTQVHDVLTGGGEMGVAMRAVDWGRTPVGDPATWPQSLRTAVSILLESRFPMYIAWGPAFVQFYNDGYRPILGSTKHPAALGVGASTTFAESWHIIGPMFDGVRAGTAVGAQDWMLPLDRHGFLEECYFTGSYSPIRDESGGVGGVFVTATETTGRVLGERRLRTLRNLAARVGDAQRPAEAWQAAAAALAGNLLDTPFALLFERDEGTGRTTLVAQAGWGATSPDALAATLTWPAIEIAAAGSGARLVTELGARGGALPGGPWPESPTSALVLPIARTSAAPPYGFLVAGLSPRRTVDDDYRGFLHLVADQIATALGNACTHEQERNRAAETQRLLVDATRAAHAREETLAMVSHDLRTPLSAIVTAAELLERSLGHDEPDARRRKRVDVIMSSADRMNRQLADLLDSASIEAGTLSIDPQRHAPGAVLDELRELFEPLAAKKQIALTFAVAAEVPTITADKERVLQVLSNLLSNAIKFTPAGGTVDVRVDAADIGVQFRVRDSGPGVSADARDHIFDRNWHRVRGNRDGHGLGLFIAMALVRLHGGQLALESTGSTGSTFVCTLPREPREATVPVASRPDPRESFVQGGGECGALIRAFDWSTTSLGPLADWPQSLRTSVSTMLRSPYPITLFWGRDLVMLYNDPFRPIHGDKHPATIGASAPQALSEAWEILGPLVAQTLATGEPLFVQNGAVFFARAPGGMREEAYFTWSYNPTIGEDGAIAGLFAIASETTRQVLGDRRLAVLRELSLRTAFDKTVRGVFDSLEMVLAQAGADLPFCLLYIVDADAAHLVACTGLARGLPASPAEPTRDTPWPIAEVARRKAEILVTDLAAVAPLPGGPHAEPATRALVLPVPIVAEGGTIGVLVVGLSPLLPLDDDYRSFLQLLARQVSASVSSARAYEEESQRAAKLAQLDRAKTDFFSNVSHELRTPLTLILGPVEDALAQPAHVLEGPPLQLVRRNALRLYKMVNALLDFSRIEAGRVQATFVPTDLAAFTANLASHFQSATERAGLTLVVDCPPLPEAIYVDPEMWEKIVLNLLSNAVKYTHRGEIRVAVTWEAVSAVVSVADTGVGIAASELPRVFERFYRVQETHGRSHEGTGIGLALAKELVELHGGTVTAASTLGVGTTITVKLPRGSAHLPAERIDRAAQARSTAAGAAAFVEEAIRWSAGAPSAPPPGDAPLSIPGELARSRILLVDDNADLREYVASILGRLFPQIETAQSGREALARVRERAPDLIISDVMMPVMDGFELVRELRADPRTASVPIILLSARAGDEATVEGLSSGADDYLVKPFSAREMVARVRSQLEMSRVRAEAWTERGKVEELRRSVAARDEFISVSSHELRTPLTALQLQLESLLSLTDRGPIASDRLTSKLGVALRQTERLTRLVEALLDASRVSLDALDLEREEMDLAELVQAVVARLEDDVRPSGTSFRTQLSPARGRWDRRRIDEVLTGLLSNAIKYAPGTAIAIEVRSDDDVATVIVRDAGRGIASEDLERVFERFERGVSADSYGGFGIGLFLAKQIVLAHGGSLTATATPGGGATLTATLPCTPPEVLS